MQRPIGVLISGVILSVVGVLTVTVGVPGAEAQTKCAADAVPVGAACVDKHEASVWSVPPSQEGLIKKIRQGKATLGDLTSPAAVAAGVVERGSTSDDYGRDCPDTGNGCVDFYAVSIPGVTPSAFITWFQAAAAARNSGKRLPTNQEWQVAALGTPDGAPCNVSSGSVANTGSVADCVSDVGAFDMVGNLFEWVADWVPRSSDCGNWGSFSDDFQCLAGASTMGFPGVLVRGGDFDDGAYAGVFAVYGFLAPSRGFVNIGFRAAR